MKVSIFIALLAWSSVIMLAWFVTIGKVEYNSLSLGVWIAFIIIGLVSGLLTFTTTGPRNG